MREIWFDSEASLHPVLNVLKYKLRNIINKLISLE